MKASLLHNCFWKTVLAQKSQELYGRWLFYLFIKKINKKKVSQIVLKSPRIIICKDKY